MKNHGVIAGKLPNDWIAGAIPWENRNPSGNWYPYLVVGEKQYFSDFDTMACVSFATNNAMEIQIKHQTGVEKNFSDRYLAKMSDTMHTGNYVSKVLDTWRKVGAVDETLWPKPPEPATWDGYYAPIPLSIQNEGAKALELYNVQYEYIPEHDAASVKHHLQHAPLLITIPGHEITGIVIDSDDTTLTILDDYIYNVDPTQPFVRKIKLADVTDIYKAVLTVKPMGQFKTQNYKGELRLVLQADSEATWEALCKVYGVDPKKITEVIN